MNLVVIFIAACLLVQVLARPQMDRHIHNSGGSLVKARNKRWVRVAGTLVKNGVKKVYSGTKNGAKKAWGGTKTFLDKTDKFTWPFVMMEIPSDTYRPSKDPDYDVSP